MVPGWLEGGVCAWLKNLAAIHANALEIHQHGFTHADYRVSTNETKYEFGPTRSFASQLADISQGATILRKEFGPHFVRVFSPPFGEYDDNTVSVLKQLPMEALTALRPDATLDGLLQFPCDVDFLSWNPPRERSPDELSREWQQLSHETRVVVVHPSLTCKESLEPVVSLLEQWSGQYKCCLFQDLVNYR